MPDQSTSRSDELLLLVGDETLAPAWLGLLLDRAGVRRAADPRAALQEVTAGNVGWVLGRWSELVPLATADGRESAHQILDNIPHGVCVIDPGGALLWSNLALRAYPPETVEAVRATCAELAAEFIDAGERRVVQRQIRPPGYVFDLTLSVIRGGDGGRFVGLVSDVSSLVRVREKLEAIDEAGRELVALQSDESARLDVPERLRILEDNLIRSCRDLLHFSHFAVRVLDPASDRLDTVLAGGFPEQAKATNIYARPQGNGISGFVAATGRSYICPDVTRDPLYLAGVEAARSSLTVPLRLNERVVGVFNVESDQPAAFTDDDRLIAEIFGRYIAIALHTLKLLVVERSETTGQIAADVRAELAQPLDDIVAEATHLLHDNPEPAAAQFRLRAILGKVEQVKETLQALASPQAIRGLAGTASAINPHLHNRRVLVADDEDIIRETIADVLAKAGALPVMARDGEEAIAMLRAQPFDLVLSDIKMPFRNGYEVFAVAKEMNPECPVILITGFGYDPDHSIVRASREGLAGVLFKPFRVEQLMELIEKALVARPAA